MCVCVCVWALPVYFRYLYSYFFAIFFRLFGLDVVGALNCRPGRLLDAFSHFSRRGRFCFGPQDGWHILRFLWPFGFLGTWDTLLFMDNFLGVFEKVSLKHNLIRQIFYFLYFIYY